MPFVVRSDSENEAELVFLSPEEEVGPIHSTGDQGASPVRCVGRTARGSPRLPTVRQKCQKTSSKKKKGSSPDPGKSMPKIPRTPQQGQEQEQVPEQAQQSKTPASEL